MDCLHKTITDNYSVNKEDSLAKVKRIPGNLKINIVNLVTVGTFMLRSTVQEMLWCFVDDLDNEEQSVPSPKNDEDVIGLAIEGKRESHNHYSLQYQLFTNIILTCVSTVIKHIKNNQYSEDFIVEVNKLSGYGIAFTGYGHFGFYKLSIHFGQPMEFVTKIPLKVHPGQKLLHM